MYDQDRPRNLYRSRSREQGSGNYRRDSRSPPRRRDEGDHLAAPSHHHGYYRSRKEDDEGADYHPHHHGHGHGHSHTSRAHYNDSSLPYDDDASNFEYRDRRARSRSRSPRRQHPPPPGRPSSTLIVEGLPNDATEDDILDGFASVSPDTKVFDPENVKVIRLRNNKRGRRIGFVEFFHVNDAAHFLDYHYPGLEFQLAHSRGVESDPVGVGINYSRGREDEGGSREERGRDEQDWKCPECTYMNYGSRNRCHRCRGAKPEGFHRGHDAAYGPKLTGETDECPQQSPSQYLVFRGLDPTITEEGFAEGVKQLYVEKKPEPKKETQNKLKSTAPTANTASLGAKQDSLRRVFLIRDKRTDEAMRYGFAEFATLEDAQGAMAKFKASPKFSISSKLVTVAFIHTGVFIPHTGRVTEENSRYVFSPIYNRDIFLKYWDNRVYPSILKVSDDADVTKRRGPENTDSLEKPGNSGTDEVTTAQDASGKKIKKFKIGQTAVKAAPVMGSQLQMWAKKRAELAGERARHNDSVETSPAPSERTRVSTRSLVKESYTSYSDLDSLSCLLCMRKFDSLVALRDHEALNKDHQTNISDEEKRITAIERLRASNKRPQSVTLRINTSRHPHDRIYTSYADRDSLHCLICQRKFTQAGMLSLHERESEMHRINIADQSNIDRAISQLARMGKTPRKMVPAKNKGMQYRDRARERRQVYNQPNAPRRKAAGDTAAPAKEPEKPAAPSKGASLLGKMGWTAGEGLGADKSGRTDVIATDVYAMGVGLGAEGGKIGDAATEAARKTKDNYTDFVEVTRNKARERYGKLD